MRTAFTGEIDDTERAVAEITEQLLIPDEHLLRSSVGILAFHPDFLETGVVKAVSEALPCDSIGGTTSALAVPGTLGDLLLSVTVLTSDDVEFRAGAVLLEDDYSAPIRELYTRLAPHAGEKPALLLTAAPVIYNAGGDEFLEALDAESGGVPVFGSLAASPLPGFSGLACCMNGAHHTNLFTLIAAFGDVDPQFYHTDIPNSKVIQQNAVITQAERNLLRSVNGMSTLDYLETIGLAENGNIIAGIESIPLVLDLDDGTRLVRAISRTTQQGHIQVYGNVLQGAAIGFSGCDAQDVLSTARQSVVRPLAAAGRECALIISCEARKWTLGARPTAEMHEIAEGLDTLLPYRIVYAAGEFCPVKTKDGRLVNSFQNFSMIACVL
ncbi:MAG: FIST C-terminal domain-containing protein [Desulfovibrio sp.]|jgi:hypothetical protein|nr:FIST C-terminal domain-containing protein [Desulfovibrio sp.]